MSQIDDQRLRWTDRRGFHDPVLGSRPLPLGGLAEVVAGWVRAPG
jgi:hypothetical protein